MRVLYVINSFTWGGAEKLVHDLSIGVSKKAEFVGIAALYKQNDETETEMVNTLESHGIKTMILGKTAGKGRLKGIADIFKFAKANKIDVIHGHCSVPMLFSKIVGKLLNVPVVCTIHSTKGYSAKREKLTSWMAFKYISIGQAAENYMIDELGIKKDKIVRIYNAIDTGIFTSGKKRPDFWKEFGGQPGDQVVLNVARVHQAKNQICLAKAVHSCVKKGNTNIKAYILGYYDKNDPIFMELNRYIKDAGITDHVKFLGMHQNVNDFLANADCFVMTSRFEGLSVAFLEAVISGIAIVTTDMPFVKELNDIAECAAVIPQNDDKKLAEILMERTYAPQDKKTVEIFKEKFSMDQFVEQHFSLYNAH